MRSLVSAVILAAVSGCVDLGAPSWVSGGGADGGPAIDADGGVDAARVEDGDGGREVGAGRDGARPEEPDARTPFDADPADVAPEPPPPDGGPGARFDAALPLDASAGAPEVAPVGPPASCDALHLAQPAAPSGVYEIDPDGAGGNAPFPVFCEMARNGGGWTLLLKTNGSSRAFAYEAAAWTDDVLVNAVSRDLTPGDAKLAGWSSVPFSRVLLGLAPISDPAAVRWTVLKVSAPSLKALFSGPSDTIHSIGRATWLGLLAGSDLQPACNREGVNLVHGHARLRLGILGNNENDCAQPDSWLGIGGGTLPAICGFPATTVTSGNAATCMMAPAVYVDRAAFGFVLVR